jgi:AcrR family transcriptional regulator
VRRLHEESDVKTIWENSGMEERDKNHLSRAAQRRIREKEERRGLILKAAMGLFASEGYNHASMERIADEAEVSTGTLYFNFRNKEDILVHLMDEIAYEIRSLVGAEFRMAENPHEGIRRSGIAFMTEFCRRHPEKIAILYRESVGKSNLVESHREKMHKQLIADLQSAVELLRDAKGYRFRSGLTPEIIATCIGGMYERIAYQFIIWQDRSGDLQEVSRELVDFILGGIDALRI